MPDVSLSDAAMSRKGSFILTLVSLLAMALPWLLPLVMHTSPGTESEGSKSGLISVIKAAATLGSLLGVFSILIGASTLGFNGWGSSRYFAGQEYAHARSAFMLGLALHVLAAYFTIPYFRLAYGASIRDMFTPMLWLFLLMMSFAVVLPLAMRARKGGTHAGVVLACLMLGFSPLATSITLYSWAQNLRQFTLAH